MLTGRKLLLADDSLTIQKVVSLTFGDEGMEVVAVGSGDEALKQLAQTVAPDIVLADVFMPEPNGYQLCAHIRHDERLRHTPVLLLVGTFEPFNEAEARRVGADDVLTKPFQSIRELVSKVGQLLGGRKAEQSDEPAARDEAAEAERTAPTLAAPASATQESSAPPAFTWARPAEEPAPTSQAWTPVPETQAAPYNDFDMDDQTIQTTPAEAFGSHVNVSEGDSEQMAHEVEVAGDWAQAHTEETSFIVLDEPQPAPAQAEAQSVPELSYATSAPLAPEFVPRVAQSVAADDALLDLGEGERVASVAVTEDDEFILDLDEEMFAPAQEATAAAPRVMYAEGLASSPAEAAAPLVTDEAPHTDARALEADAQAYEQPPQSGQAVELVLPETMTAEPPQAMEASTTSGAVAEAATTEAPEVHEPSAQEAAQPEMAAPAVDVEAGSAVSVEQGGAAQLSPEMVDAVARRVVELMSDKVVREVAWEVIPDLAERLIKRRLEEERPTEAR